MSVKLIFSIVFTLFFSVFSPSLLSMELSIEEKINKIPKYISVKFSNYKNIFKDIDTWAQDCLVSIGYSPSSDRVDLLNDLQLRINGISPEYQGALPFRNITGPNDFNLLRTDILTQIQTTIDAAKQPVVISTEIIRAQIIAINQAPVINFLNVNANIGNLTQDCLNAIRNLPVQERGGLLNTLLVRINEMVPTYAGTSGFRANLGPNAFNLLRTNILTQIELAKIAINLQNNEFLTEDIDFQDNHEQLHSLHNHNAWFAHESFWAAAGVIDPQITHTLKHAFSTHKGTPIEFVVDLTSKLNLAINSITGNPAPQAVVELVQLSQQILLTLSAGVPADDSTFTRLAPGNVSNSNTGDWEIIRKAMFLALSVTSDPTTAGNTFLSTLYDCGQFYHKKTDADAVKAYYFKLDAFSRIFSDIWKGNSDLGQVVKNNDLSNYYASHKRSNTVVGGSFLILKKAYEEAAAATDINRAKSELATALVLHPKLGHEQAFRTLYPDLTMWATYHTPAPRAVELMTGKLVKLSLPTGFAPQAINLVYQATKWHLKVLKLDSAGKTLGEATLWSQGVNAKESFTGSLDDSHGTHLFNFDVDGPSTTIKAISTGYMVRIGGVGSTTTVASDKDLGIIESSAYSLNKDIYTNKEDSVIFIEGESYHGMRGVLTAHRDSVWIQAPTINLRYDYDFAIKTHNGKPYNFYSPQGQEIVAHKDVILFGDNINLARSHVKAGQDAYFGFTNPSDSKLTTQGSIIQSGNGLTINLALWEADTQTVFAGSDGSSSWQNPSDLVPNSGQAVLDYGRHLSYSAYRVEVLNDSEYNTLLKGPHAYGVYNSVLNRTPSFTYVVANSTGWASGGGFNGGRGSSSFGSGFTSTNTGWGMGPKSAPIMTRSQQPSSMSSMSLTSGELSFSNRGGNTNIGGSFNFGDRSSSSSSTTLGFGLTRGDGGNSGISSLSLSSSYNPPSLTQSLEQWVNPLQPNSALNLHMLSSAAILQMTASKKLNVVPLALAYYGGAAVIATVGTIVLGKKAIDDTKKILNTESQSSSVSSMMPPDPDDDGKESPWDSWQNLPKETHDGKTYAKIGDKLYTQHAVDAMQPSSLGVPAGNIRAGRSIAPRFVEDAIKTGVREIKIMETGIERSLIRSGNIEVITENADKIIITVKHIGRIT